MFKKLTVRLGSRGVLPSRLAGDPPVLSAGYDLALPTMSGSLGPWGLPGVIQVYSCFIELTWLIFGTV